MATVEDKTLDNGDQYKGWTEKGKKEKFGQLKQKDGTFVEGEFKNDKLNGVARCLQPDGTQYSGRYANGKKSGIGQLHFKTFTFLGKFDNDQPASKGIYEYNNGEIHKGEFKNQKLQGFGVIQNTKTGAVLRGDFVEGNLHGYGQEIVSPDLYYEGNFKNGVKEGLGKCLNKEGYGLQGEYKNGTLQGFGIESSKEKYFYGNFDANGNKNGEAMIIEGAKQYVGSVIDGKPDGFGKYSSQKEMFLGTMKEGHKEGLGLE